MISIIAAISENGAIGKDNKLLWYIPEDLKRFKKITSSHPVIMGRKTYNSIGRLLPDRLNIIITRDSAFAVEGAVIAHSLQEAIDQAKKADPNEIFIIGGGQIFKDALPLADKLYLTVVKGTFDADVFFPDYSEFKTVKHQQESSTNGYNYTFIDLTR